MKRRSFLGLLVGCCVAPVTGFAVLKWKHKLWHYGMTPQEYDAREMVDYHEYWGPEGHYVRVGNHVRVHFSYPDRPTEQVGVQWAGRF